MARKKKDIPKVYFPGLHGLRFVAALMVLFSHVELMKDYHGYSNLYASNVAVYEMGRMGVTLFFVLSGFLISYLLLSEKEFSGTISVRKFYVRRILRIWPLYYLLVFIAFVVLPHLGFFSVPKYTALVSGNFRYTFPLYLILLPQVALSIFDPVPFAEPLWSIGVEEQFYAIWPWLVKYFKKFLPVCIGLIIGGIIIKQCAFWIAEVNRSSPSLKYWNYLLSYLYFTRIECMAVGGVAAWLFFARRRRMLRLVYHPLFQVCLYAGTIYLLVTTRYKPVYNYGLYAGCLALIILNIATNPRSIIKLENSVFVFLGNISFSIYMFHEIIIKSVLAVLARTWPTAFDDVWSNLVLYVLVLTGTLIISTATYYGFERRFLRLKSSYAVIESGQDLIEKHLRLVPVTASAA
jgi:peptidoglycan/LPS O-acetylase OafA/YrhL